MCLHWLCPEVAARAAAYIVKTLWRLAATSTFARPRIAAANTCSKGLGADDEGSGTMLVHLHGQIA